MDLAVTIIFHLFAFIFFIFALYEERDTKTSDEEEEKSDHLCILLLLFSCICFWIAGVTMFSVTETYYSVTTDALETFDLRIATNEIFFECQKNIQWYIKRDGGNPQ